MQPEENGKTVQNKNQQIIAAAIERIRAVENQIPGVIIIHNLQDTSVVHMSASGLKHLGVDLETLQNMGAEYHSYFFNPEDAKDYVPQILGLLEKNNDDDFVSNFQQVRQSPRHDWSWYISATKIFLRDDEGKPLLILTISLPVDAQHHMARKAERLLEENNFLRSHHHLFNTLTSREKEVLRLMALGETAEGIAGKLFISMETVNTHRRNIKRKLKAKTTFDLMRYAQAFDLL